MVLALNLVPIVIVLLLCYCVLRKKIGLALFLGLVLIVYTIALPSYIPKGEVKRTEVPAFEKSDAVISDRNRKPDYSLTERTEMLDNKYKNGMSFLGSEK